ncbi:hypothetical protein AYR46_08395 [Sphingobium yanoikuyae]|nr:hypothetical protein AYR46_08395 [Sphingobium yanoikuyae]
MAGVRHSLKDPESARFEGLQAYSEARVACGKVNAKNSMGGYVGNEEFSYYLERPYLESTDIEAKVEGTKRCLLAEAQRAVVDLKSSNYPNKDELIKDREEQIEDLRISIGTSSSD